MRRLFLDEFFGNSDVVLDKTFKVSETSNVLSDTADARAKAEAFYTRVLSDYGDDSVGELGGAHLAFQEVSQIAAKTIEDHRIGLAFLEKSSRYVPFDDKVNGQYRYYRDRNLMASPYGTRVLEHLDGLFDTYSAMLPRMMAYLEQTHPIDDIEFENAITAEIQTFAQITDQEFSKSASFAYKSAVRAQACDLLRCLLPMATLTNVGVWGNGRALEYLLLNLLADPFTENRGLGRAGALELSSVIGPFVKRADDDKGKRLQEYLQGRRVTLNELRKKYLDPAGKDLSRETKPDKVTLVHYDNDAVEAVTGAILFGASDWEKARWSSAYGVCPRTSKPKSSIPMWASAAIGGTNRDARLSTRATNLICSSTSANFATYSATVCSPLTVRHTPLSTAMTPANRSTPSPRYAMPTTPTWSAPTNSFGR